MAAPEYFARQAAALLRLAKAVKNPKLSAGLLVKAADLEEKAQDATTSSPLVTPALRDHPKD